MYKQYAVVNEEKVSCYLLMMNEISEVEMNKTHMIEVTFQDYSKLTIICSYVLPKKLWFWQSW